MSNSEIEQIALFDLDGTLCDYDKAMLESLNYIKSPSDPEITSIRDAPGFIERRADLIRSTESWWENLPKFQLGWDVLEVAREVGYHVMILTQGPKKNPASWAGKKKWIDKNLGPNTDVTITRDKGLVYGKVFVDDYPEYIDRWLSWRKRGLVIMPANNGNVNYSHPQVIRYDGTNLEKVRESLIRVKDRRRGEKLIF